MSGEARRERKVVSVLFADLVGFTSRAETREVGAARYLHEADALTATNRSA